jgi:hypothetical protein
MHNTEMLLKTVRDSSKSFDIRNRPKTWNLENMRTSNAQIITKAILLNPRSHKRLDISTGTSHRRCATSSMY